jgi:alkylation response protein AidB-like acyl-CoA dehydrogenase
MMNAARFSMAAQALAIADRAYQSALAYAKERLQSSEVGSNSHAAAPIIKHADVRRMLLSLKSQIEAMRADLRCRGIVWISRKHPDAAVRTKTGKPQRENPMDKSIALEDRLISGLQTKTATRTRRLSAEIAKGRIRLPIGRAYGTHEH